jgi:hypothetical protein
MPVSIDSVYQRVLALANKEQRGYITPLEFNLFANHAQLTIFEQYFYDLNQFKTIGSDETTLSDMSELIKNKLTVFTDVQTLLSGATTYPPNYRTGRIFAHDYEVELVTINEVRDLLDSQFHRKALLKNPVFVESRQSGQDVRVFDGVSITGRMTSGVSCEVITEPIKAEWGYDVIEEKALYNASRSTNFELHESEEMVLVLKILELAGITLVKPGLTQMAEMQEIAIKTSQK